MKINLTNYETMTVDDAIDRFDWGYDADNEKPVYHRLDGVLDVFAAAINPELGDFFTCEIYDVSAPWTPLAQQKGATVDDAIGLAYLELNGRL